MLTLTPGQVVPYISGNRIKIGTVLGAVPKKVFKMFNRPGKRPNYGYELWLIQPHEKRRPGEPDKIKIREDAIRKAMEIQERAQ
jgi:hypothetical protein